MVSEHIRKMTGWHWIGLYGAILVAWGVLYAMSLSVGDLRELRAIYGAEFWATLCVVSPDGGFFRLFLMWSLMSIAMMAPTALPAFATYDDLGAVAQTDLWKLIVGYLVVWIGFSWLQVVCKWRCLFTARWINWGNQPHAVSRPSYWPLRGVSVFTCERSLPVQMSRAADLFHAVF